ncbi:MAG: glucuronyl hydrolase, partial [Chitinophagaceae bacterium]
MTVLFLRKQNLIPAIFTIVFACLSVCSYSQGKKSMGKLISRNMELADKQYKYMASLTPADSMPRSYDAAKNKLIVSTTRWWTSGFFPASLWYIYLYTKDTAIRSEAERRLAILEKEKYATDDHDLGFMIFCSFGNAYKITHNPDYRDVCAIAAESLIKRYKPAIKAIQSWG